MFTKKFKLNEVPELEGKNIIDKKKLSESFGMITEKILFDNNKSYISKSCMENNKKFNSIISEAKSLEYMYNLFPKFFPRVIFYQSNILVMDFIEHDNKKNEKYEYEIADIIANIHKNKNSKFGFYFDTQIGGLEQPSKFSDNWIDFYKNNRLGMIFNLINKNNPMPSEINKEIEKILNNLENFIPNEITPRLIHGDLWEGNILFDKGKLKGLIDPGIYFAHNELEIAYLTWFKYVSKNFLNYYSEKINIDKYYYKYEPVYQLYYCLLNVHLWSRDYIDNAKELINKINL